MAESMLMAEQQTDYFTDNARTLLGAGVTID